MPVLLVPAHVHLDGDERSLTGPRPPATRVDDTCCKQDNRCSLSVVSSRRELLLDAAIRVLGERGVRAVTHRAVDAEAGVGAGSTANYFATREALFQAIVERFAQRERADFEEVAARVCPTSAAELGRAFAESARDSAGRNRILTLSRYALLVESANNPVLREQMAATGARVSSWLATWLRLIGSTDPDYHVHVVGNYLTGLVLHQLAIPDPHFDPTDKIISLLESLVRPGPASSPGAYAAAAHGPDTTS
jgi:DNA-binding transcriptional regulator YbjK